MEQKHKFMIFHKISKFSVRLFLLILIFAVIPLCGLSIYVRGRMESFIREKLSEKVIQNIARGERNITDALQDMASMTNIFVNDTELQKRITDPSITEFENTKYFDQMLNRQYMVGSQELWQDMKIILFDNYGRSYSNWSLNYQDYKFLLEQDWVKESMEQNGHVVWSMFSTAYVVGAHSEETYISLARMLLEDGTAGVSIGTLIISIDQQKFSDLLMEYAYPGDAIYVCIDDGILLLKNDIGSFIREESVPALYKRTKDKKSGSLRYTFENEEYLVSYYTIPKPWLFDGQQMKIFHYTSYQEVRNEVARISYQMNLFIFVIVVVLTGGLYLVVREFVKPITVLSQQMNEYNLEQELKDIDIAREDEVGHLNRAFVQMSDNVRHLFRKLEDEHEIKEQYRYESLRAQLNPHFLFNTLTTIRWMAIIRGADNIVESIDALANMLRYSINNDEKLVSVRDEVKNIMDYLYIQNCRYGNHCQLEVDLPEEVMELKTMKFILQPIVENAVIHGYDRNREEIKIQICGCLEKGHLILYVEDDGIGMIQTVIEEFESSKHSQRKTRKLTGIGMKNVDECIRIAWGNEYGITIASQEHSGTVVQFTLPIIREEQQFDETSNDCG